MKAIEQALARHIPAIAQAGRYVVAFSGGRDSSVLLHALARFRPDSVTAIHVFHGMQADARAWIEHCQSVCVALNVPLEIIDVAADVADLRSRHGPEAGAREARYAALAARLQSEDLLLTAHHRRDQSETLLLQAFRGSGPAGLSGMPALRALGRGRHCRPFLGLSREAITAYAEEAGLSWLEDPSNADQDLDRARLRRLWPQLEAGWPGIEATLARSADNMAEATELLGDLARLDLATLQAEATGPLDVRMLSRLSPPRQANALRHWLMSLNLELPGREQLRELKRQLAETGGQSQLRLAWGDTEVRGHAGCLFAMSRLGEPDRAGHDWPPADPAGPSAATMLYARPVLGQGLSRSLGPYHLRLRQGGERLQLAGREHRSQLKQLLQQAGIPTWVRARLPLVFAGERLVAVADYWCDPAWAPAAGEPGWVPEWRHDLVGVPPNHIVRERAFG